MTCIDDRRAPARFDMRFLDLLLGRRIATDEDENERVGTFAGVGVLGLDALASAAYGPEALLTALLPLGAAALDHVWLLTCVIIALLLLVGASYAQTIVAYTNGGGAYTVAKENLGTRPSLVAAAALAMDYVLNVAVAISAGVGALASACSRPRPRHPRRPWPRARRARSAGGSPGCCSRRSPMGARP